MGNPEGEGSGITLPEQVTKSVLSTDGTEVSYTEILPPAPNPHSAGLPSGIVLMYGGMEQILSLGNLAGQLWFNTNIPLYMLHRMRGSGTLQNEIDDLAAVLRQTGADTVLAASGGALVALYAALQLCPEASASTSTEDYGKKNPLLKRLIVFEPTLVVDDEGAYERDLARFEREVAEGQKDDALVTAVRLIEFGPSLARKSRRFLKFVSKKWAVAGPEAGGASEDWVFAPPLAFDLRLAKETFQRKEEFRNLERRQVEILILSGSLSQKFLKRSAELLAKMIPKARFVVVDGLYHMGLRNENMGGNPQKAVPELKKFLVGS